MKLETKEYRVYQITDDYAVECYDEISADGQIHTTFYLFDGTQKYFCLGCQKEDEIEEQEMAKYIFYEYYPLMRQEQEELEELFWKKWDAEHKTEKNV